MYECRGPTAVSLGPFLDGIRAEEESVNDYWPGVEALSGEKAMRSNSDD